MKLTASPLFAAKLSAKVVKLAIFATASVAGVTVVSSSVFAGLTATAFNTPAHSVSTGTLKLTQTASTGSLTGGFVTAITNMAPGDTVNRYIDLSNGGSLDGAGLTLKVGDGNSTILTTSAGSGLQVTVTQCVAGYVPTTGLCTAGETAVLTTSANALLTAQAIPAISTTAGVTAHLKFALFLPSGSEITTNGTLPSPTVQNVSAALTWTFNENLRTNTNTIG